MGKDIFPREFVCHQACGVHNRHPVAMEMTVNDIQHYAVTRPLTFMLHLRILSLTGTFPVQDTGQLGLLLLFADRDVTRHCSVPVAGFLGQ